MKITLKSVEYSARLSEETNAFSAIVCIDGVSAFIASNHGQGGCDEQHPLKGQTYEQMREQIQRVEDYAKTLPVEKHDIGGGKEFETQPDMESLVGDAFTAWLTESDLHRLLKRKLLFTRPDGKLYEISLKGVATVEAQLKLQDNLRARGAQAFLNSLPFEQALEIYRKSAA